MMTQPLSLPKNVASSLPSAGGESLILSGTILGLAVLHPISWSPRILDPEGLEQLP